MESRYELELDEVITIFKPTINQTPFLPLLVIANELMRKPIGLLLGHRWNTDRPVLVSGVPARPEEDQA